MHITKNLPLLLFAVVVFSCKPETKELPENEAKDFVWVSADCSDGSAGILLCPYSYLRLFDNGSFTGGALRGYVSGTWNLDSATQQIWLKPIDKVTDTEETNFTVLEVLEKSPNSMQVAVLRVGEAIFEEGKRTMQLQKAPVSFDRDPFRVDNNLWRNKPDKPESAGQIKDRVLGYLNFLKMFYEFASKNNLERLDVDWFPTPMKMESPGSITMAYANELSHWNACFYNEEQAIEGYKIISGPFLKVKLKGNPDLNQRNVAVINQILEALETKQE